MQRTNLGSYHYAVRAVLSGPFLRTSSINIEATKA